MCVFIAASRDYKPVKPTQKTSNSIGVSLWICSVYHGALLVCMLVQEADSHLQNAVGATCAVWHVLGGLRSKTTLWHLPDRRKLSLRGVRISEDAGVRNLPLGPAWCWP